MAKKTADQVNQEQSEIGESHRATMKLSDDGNTVVVTMLLPRYVEYQLRKNSDVRIKLDRVKYAGGSRFADIFGYGEKQEISDCGAAQPTAELALKRAEMRRAYFYGERSKQQRQNGVPKLVRKATEILIQGLIAQGRDEKGQKFTKKTLPSVVCRIKTMDDWQSAAGQIGVSESSIARILASAEASCIEIDLEI